MSNQDEKFVQFLQEEAGEFLRGVLAYDDEIFEVVYLRDDLVADDDWRADAADDVPTVVDLARREHAVDDLTLFGDFAGTVRVFEDAVLIQLPWRTDYEHGGYGVSVEPAATPSLVEFIDTVSTYLRD